MRRAGRGPREVAKRGRREFVRKHWLVLLVVIAVYWIACGLVLWLQHGRPYLEFLTGVFVGLFPLPVYALLQLDSVQRFRDGAEAEIWTSARLKRRGRGGWQVVDSIPFDGFDVDHVAFGPRGVIAVETKFTTQHWRVAGDRLEGPISDPLDQARRNAFKIRSLLRSEGVVVPVLPCLFVWGSGSAELPPHAVIDGVWMFAPARERDWPERLPQGGRLTKEELSAIERTLHGFVEMRERQKREERKRQGSPTSARPRAMPSASTQQRAR
jgi:hypothetical protein